ncbi:response regulator [Caulobacter sp. LARHSG274]
MSSPSLAIPSPATIVLLDDDDALREAMTFALEAQGFRVRAYARPGLLPKAADLAATGCFVIDQLMPGETGLTLLHRLRAAGIASPAILITTGPSSEIQLAAARLAATIVEKPLLGERLFNVLGRLLARRDGGPGEAQIH